MTSESLSWAITAAPIRPEVMVTEAIDHAVGGWVHFAGIVRNHNHGKPVTHLEYECYETLAGATLDAILAEASRSFPITGARVVHRVGRLGLGDVAVWIDVYAHHRDAAFRACRFIIDTLKRDVPIWKKEFYADGGADWTRCREHAHVGAQGHRDEAPAHAGHGAACAHGGRA